MKAHLCIIPLFCLFLASCSKNAKDLLAHKWQVDNAAYYDGSKSEMPDSLVIYEYVQANESAGTLYNGRIYDLHKDGTYTAEGGAADKSSGTWEVDGNLVLFKARTGESQTWFFSNDRPEVSADSSLYIRLSPSKEKYLSLIMKPVPGETVTVDFDD